MQRLIWVGGVRCRWQVTELELDELQRKLASGQRERQAIQDRVHELEVGCDPGTHVRAQSPVGADLDRTYAPTID